MLEGRKDRGTESRAPDRGADHGRTSPWRVAMLASVLAMVIAASGGRSGQGQLAGLGQGGDGRPFRIGYLQSEAGSPLDGEWFRRLRVFLENDSRLRSALKREGYGEVRVVAAEGFNDLVRRMQVPEFESVFCPAVAFCRQLGDYTVVFQVRKPTDVGGRKYIFRHGIVIVNRNHPLYRAPEERRGSVPRAVIAKYFASEPVALVSRYSAPGWIYPVIELSKSRMRAWPSRPVFCGSSEEVVKMVLSDVVRMGACERGAVEQVLRHYGVGARADRVVDVLLTTAGSPADPVVFLKRFGPERSELGRRLKNALARFFGSNRPGQLRLEDSDDGAFGDLRAALEEFDRLTGGE